jgi:hypothetical protein
MVESGAYHRFTGISDNLKVHSPRLGYLACNYLSANVRIIGKIDVVDE